MGGGGQAITTTNTGESESIAWSTTAKNAIRLGALVEYTRSGPVTIYGKLDNQAVEQAILKGYCKMDRAENIYERKEPQNLGCTFCDFEAGTVEEYNRHVVRHLLFGLKYYQHELIFNACQSD